MFQFKLNAPRNAVLAVMATALTLASPVSAQDNGASPISETIIPANIVKELQAMLKNPVVVASIRARNTERKAISQSEIDALDALWRKERESDGTQPTITAALGSPLSTFLLRKQAASKGLYSEIFVMDLNGLNVGQSSITSDFWQGDEAKFQKTVPFGANTVFIDKAEYIDSVGIWVAQVNMTLDDNGEVIGSATIEVNLTELQRRMNAGL